VFVRFSVNVIRMFNAGACYSHTADFHGHVFYHYKQLKVR
jgi:hypothetical protein